SSLKQLSVVDTAITESVVNRLRHERPQLRVTWQRPGEQAGGQPHVQPEGDPQVLRDGETIRWPEVRPGGALGIPGEANPRGAIGRGPASPIDRRAVGNE